jgi:hypothetical protein
VLPPLSRPALRRIGTVVTEPCMLRLSKASATAAAGLVPEAPQPSLEAPEPAPTPEALVAAWLAVDRDPVTRAEAQSWLEPPAGVAPPAAPSSASSSSSSGCPSVSSRGGGGGEAGSSSGRAEDQDTDAVLSEAAAASASAAAAQAARHALIRQRLGKRLEFGGLRGCWGGQAGPDASRGQLMHSWGGQVDHLRVDRRCFE